MTHYSFFPGWNVHSRITVSSADAHIKDWLSLSPPISITTPLANAKPLQEKHSTIDLDTPDELALRSLLLGVVHRSISHFSESREFLLDVAKYPAEGKWTHALALFELAVLKLKEMEASDKEVSLLVVTPGNNSKTGWALALDEASEILHRSAEAAVGSDLHSRLESRITMFRDEIALKRKITSGQ